MSKKNDDYILVTPAKDEEDDLPSVIRSVTNQTKKPVVWLIVNDGSTDKTAEIIRKACKKYSWIKTINLPERERDIGLGYAFVCRSGFEFILDYCKKNNIEYQYIGLLDADIILEPNYFGKLIHYFEHDEKLGVASGSTWNYDGEKYIMVKDRPDEPCGAARLWRKNCFFETEGYILTYAPDTISNIKCRLNGWKTQIFFELKIKQTRMTSSAEGLWKGYLKKGEADYFLYMPLTYIGLRTIIYSCRSKFFLGFAYLTGYFNSIIKKRSRITDKDIINYNRGTHLKKVIESIIKK